MRAACKVTALFVHKGIVPEQKKAIYEYGFELLISDLINFLIILGVACFTKQVWQSILYLIIFTGLRSCSGGYHAKTHLCCRCCTVGVYIVFLILNSILIPDYVLIYLLGDVIASIPIIIFAPIQNVNRPLSEETRKKNKKRAIGLFYSLTILATILCFYRLQSGVAISLVLWIVAACMIPAIKNCPIRRKKT